MYGSIIQSSAYAWGEPESNEDDSSLRIAYGASAAIAMFASLY